MSLVLPLDGEGPRYAQLYRALREAVVDGRFAPGSRLPGSRTLARDLGLSRNTVLEAVGQLLDEGYVTARPGSGTFVSACVPDGLGRVAGSVLPGDGASSRALAASSRIDASPGEPSPRGPSHGGPSLGAGSPRAGATVAARTAAASKRAAPRLSRLAERAVAVAPAGSTTWDVRRGALPYDFRYGEPAYQDFPFDLWARLLGRRMRRARLDDLAYRHPGGHPELRTELAAYLAKARGVRCSPEQIVVVYGSQQAVDLTARLLIEVGDRVALEDPHYPGFRLALEAAGAELVPIPVDQDGLDVDRLRAEPDLRLVCVTPSHQFPTGAVLPAARRLALLEWAEERGAVVLEDDYDSEYRYAARPLPSLQSLDRHGRVIYVGTFSKVLFPALRTGYAVLPEPLLEPFLRLKALADTGSSPPEQVVLAEFLRDGHFERHLRRARARNGERRAALVEALERSFGDRVRFSSEAAGLHLMVELPGWSADRALPLRRAARARGVGIYPTDASRFVPATTTTFLLGYAPLEPDRIREGVELLAAACDDVEAGEGAGASV